MAKIRLINIFFKVGKYVIRNEAMNLLPVSAKEQILHYVQNNGIRFLP
ncbi:hypothetical protein [Bacteroides congonensis]